MNEIRFTRKAIIQAGVIGAGALVMLLCGLSQEYGIGQSYTRVVINDNVAGFVPSDVNVKAVVQDARRGLATENGDIEKICLDFDWRAESTRDLFQKLSTEEELRESVKEIIKNDIADEKERAYTVAIEDYRANFRTLDEIREFLDEVKAPSDEDGEYTSEIILEESHVSGILSAYLTETEPAVYNEPEVTMAEEIGSGVSRKLAAATSYAEANADDGSYKTGILDMEFVESVEVYENYIHPDEFSDIAEEVTEVTKEKESNKIYEVESGDCLSVIAMDHDTTVASIMALNGITAESILRIGQELIIAVPEPDLQLRITVGEVYEEDYNEDPIIIENDSWYTTKEVTLQEGTTGHRERNDVVVYENGIESSRNMIHENVMVASTAAVIERGTIIPPTYIKPLAGGHYTSGFGYRWGRLHKGVDWGCPTGTTVYASCAGTVIQAAYSGGYGNVVVISHPDGRMTRYAHNSKLLVKVGQYVEQGQSIALSGSTGRSTGPHVHFELYINGSAVNPLNYISY
jgi:murein DD-endopeptidase MepM/ murein hydrolase activator NlpD